MDSVVGQGFDLAPGRGREAAIYRKAAPYDYIIWRGMWKRSAPNAIAHEVVDWLERANG
jgi:hypothetical protein